MSLWRKKSLVDLLAQAENSQMKRTLGAGSLIALGIGAIIGAGLFVRTAAAASEAAGSGVTISFIIAAIGCALAGLCYAEFASMIPISGSAYAYSFVTMGELVAWIIGWSLIMEYALGAATVGVSWSGYFNKLLHEFGTEMPLFLSKSFAEVDGGGINLPAVVIVSLLSLMLIRGTKESASLNNILVIVKVCVVILFIVLGWKFIVIVGIITIIFFSFLY